MIKQHEHILFTIPGCRRRSGTKGTSHRARSEGRSGKRSNDGRARGAWARQVWRWSQTGGSNIDQINTMYYTHDVYTMCHTLKGDHRGLTKQHILDISSDIKKYIYPNFKSPLHTYVFSSRDLVRVITELHTLLFGE